MRYTSGVRIATPHDNRLHAAAFLCVLGLTGCGEPPPVEDPEPVPHEEPADPNADLETVDEAIDEATGEPPADESDEPEVAEPAAHACSVPAIPIPRPSQCADESYPACKWQLPHATLAEGRYRRWRNTIVEHHWGRPALVSWILASLDRYHQEFPEQPIAVGDLDAPGPRHVTHDRGVDVDLYALGAMMVENAGGGRYPNNFEGKSDEEIDDLRRRVEALARALATCSDGQLRIYYNDDVVKERFHSWYDEQGFEESEFGRPMQGHNHLHDFHFHVTIPEDLPLLAQEPLPDGVEHPTARIIAPPRPGDAPHLSSMNRRPGEEWGRVPRE